MFQFRSMDVGALAVQKASVSKGSANVAKHAHDVMVYVAVVLNISVTQGSRVSMRAWPAQGALCHSSHVIRSKMRILDIHRSVIERFRLG